jgi:hypothetical protein
MIFLLNRFFVLDCKKISNYRSYESHYDNHSNYELTFESILRIINAIYDVSLIILLRLTASIAIAACICILVMPYDTALS